MKVLFGFILCCIVPFSCNAQMTKSYMQMEIVSPSYNGPISASADNVGLWVQWNIDRSKIKMFDGTTWSFDKKDGHGNMIYKYQGSTSPIMPGVQYQTVLFIPDYTKMYVFYSFSMMGTTCQMRATYGYIGEGKEPAINYITGQY